MNDVWDMLIKGDWVEKLLALLVALCVAFLVGLLGLVGFYAVDSIGISARPEAATVTSKSYSPETSYATFINAGNGVQVPVINTTPEAWHAVVAVKGRPSLYCAISHAQFNRIAAGTNVEIGIGAGRFSGGDYCTSFQIPGK